MKPTELSKLWQDFKARPVDMTIHKDDMMYNSAGKPEDYAYVGESGAEVVWSVLGLAPTMSVKTVLDFGCGHGRVGRYLRNLFPYADFTFSDVDASSADFCAKTFKGRGLVTPKDFTQLEFPDTYDVIWLGSVFTHIDLDRMKILWDKLFAVLKPRGVLIGTFRGEKMYQRYLASPGVAERDREILEEYEANGAAYRKYPNWEDNWGLSLVKPQKLIEIGQRNPEARLVALSEVGWASAHDVLAWTNVSPQTVIR